MPSKSEFPVGPLNRTRLVEVLSDQTGLSRKDINTVLSAMTETIVRTVTSGHKVSLTNFGTWIPVDKGPQSVRNPKTGETWVAAPYQGVRFVLAPRFKENVRSGDPSRTIRKTSRTY